MNLTRAKKWHENEALKLSAQHKAVSARAHALRAFTLANTIKMKREMRNARKEKAS